MSTVPVDDRKHGLTNVMNGAETYRTYHLEGSHASAVLDGIARDWGYDVEFPHDGGCIAEGLIAAQRLSSGINVFATDLRTPEENIRSGCLARCLMIIVNLDASELTYVIDNGDVTARIPPGEAALIASQSEMELRCRFRAGDTSRTVAVQADPDSLRDDELAAEINQRLAKNAVATLSIGSRARALAQELFMPTSSGLACRLHAESCALELIARAIEMPLCGRAGCGLSARDVAAIERVRDKLIANIDADHRLADLAREAGMSVTTLKSKFVAMMGQPVFQFLRDRRLDRARQGLREDGWSVAQASHYVGYGHPTNFATAFRRRFGVSPREAR